MIAVLLLLVLCFLWLLRYRFRDRFLRSYGLFFTVLLIYAANKELYGLSRVFYEDAFSPLSLVRWGLLFLFVAVAVRLRRPAGFRTDVLLGVLIALLLGAMLLSAIYAENHSYSFLRAVSFILLAVAVVTGMASYLFGSVNCLHFFRFKYYTAWIVLAPLLLLYLAGAGNGFVAIIMGRYAGLFGNQNMYGTFSALIIPYVLFHWRVVARTKRARWLDAGLLLLIFFGVWQSGSRNGLVSGVLGAATYFFVINLQGRLKIIAATAVFLIALVLFPTLKSGVTSFVRKDLQNAQVTELSAQLVEEKRYDMWAGVWPLFWKQKLTGYGFAASHILVFPFTRDAEAGRSIHNSYLEMFGDLGLPGITLLLLILGRLATKSFALAGRRAEPLERQISAVFIAVFVAGSANAFFESWMFSVGNLASLMYWGALAGLAARRAWRPVAAAAVSPAVAVLPPKLFAQRA